MMLEILNSRLLDLFFDSIWIGGLFWLLLRLFLKVINPRFAKLRYQISLLLFFGLLLLLLIKIIAYEAIYKIWLEPNIMVFTNYLIDNKHIGFSFIDRLQLILIQYNQYVGILWFLGFLMYSIRLYNQSKSIRRIEESNISEYGLLLLTEYLGFKLQIEKEIVIKFARNISYPFTTGYLKPIIYFPIQAITTLSLEELELILFHELVHIKRNDYLINLIQLWVETIFFFNPFIKYISTTVKNEREASCDYTVIDAGYSKLTYAKALQHSYELHYDLSLSFGNQNVFSRIKNLAWFPASKRKNDPLRNTVLSLLFVGVILIIMSFSITTRSSLSNTDVISNTTKVYPRVEFNNDTTFFKPNPQEILYMFKDRLVGYSKNGIFDDKRLKDFERKEIKKINVTEIQIIDKTTGRVIEKMEQWEDKSNWAMLRNDLKDACILPEGGHSYYISPFNIFYVDDQKIPDYLQKKHESFIQSINPYSVEDISFVSQMIEELQKDTLIDKDSDALKIVFTPKSKRTLLLNDIPLSRKYADKYLIYLKAIFKKTLYENSKYHIK